MDTVELFGPVFICRELPSRVDQRDMACVYLMDYDAELCKDKGINVRGTEDNPYIIARCHSNDSEEYEGVFESFPDSFPERGRVDKLWLKVKYFKVKGDDKTYSSTYLYDGDERED